MKYFIELNGKEIQVTDPQFKFEDGVLYADVLVERPGNRYGFTVRVLESELRRDSSIPVAKINA